MEVGLDVELLRLLAPIPMFFGDDSGRPTYRAFCPTDCDTESAQKRGHSVRVTVWDLQRTTLLQAMAFRDRQDCRAFVLHAGDIIDVGKKFSIPTLRAVYDPLDVPAANMPGADGHVGIEGLERGAVTNETKVEWKARLHALARRLSPHPMSE